MRKFNRLIKAVIYYLKVLITGQQKTNILSIRDIHFPPDYIFNAFIDAGHKISYITINTKWANWTHFICWDPIEYIPSSEEAIHHLCGVLHKSIMINGVAKKHFDVPLYGCKCEEVIFPKSVVSIGNLIDVTDIRNVVLPPMLKEIADGAFKNTRGKCETFNLPDTIEYIGDCALTFAEIEQLNIPKSLKHLGKKSFATVKNVTVSSENPIYDSRENCNAVIESKSNTLILGSCSTVIPVGVITIGEYATNNCIISDLPHTIKCIREGAFRRCHINEMIIPEGVTEIEKCVFAETHIKKLILPKTIRIIHESAFEKCRAEEVIIVEGAKEIHKNAFRYASISKLFLPATLEKIYEGAFAESSITEIIIPEGVTEIEKGVFEGAQIQRIVLPDTITRIREKAFSGCSTRQILVPSSVTNIDYGAFEGINVRTLSFSNKVSLVDVTLNKANIGELLLPDDLEEVDSNLFNSVSIEYIILPESIRKIHKGAFKKSNIGFIKIESQVSNIEEDTFLESFIQQIILPDTLKVISKRAFYKCRMLRRIIIPNGVETIESEAFYNCCELEDVQLPITILSIGDRAFLESYKIRLMKVPIKAVVSNDFLSRCEYDYNVETIIEGEDVFRLYTACDD